MAAKLVYADLESCEENRDGCSVTLYFEGKPSKQDVVKILRKRPRLLDRLPLSCDPDDEFFSFTEYPTKVSERAGLVRVQCEPGG